MKVATSVREENENDDWQATVTCFWGFLQQDSSMFSWSFGECQVPTSPPSIVFDPDQSVTKGEPKLSINLTLLLHLSSCNSLIDIIRFVKFKETIDESIT